MCNIPNESELTNEAASMLYNEVPYKYAVNQTCHQCRRRLALDALQCSIEGRLITTSHEDIRPSEKTVRVHNYNRGSSLFARICNLSPICFAAKERRLFAREVVLLQHGATEVTKSLRKREQTELPTTTGHPSVPGLRCFPLVLFWPRSWRHWQVVSIALSDAFS